MYITQVTFVNYDCEYSFFLLEFFHIAKTTEDSSASIKFELNMLFTQNHFIQSILIS